MDDNVLKLLNKQQRKFQEWLFEQVRNEREFIVTLEMKDTDEKTQYVIPAKRVLDEILDHKDPFEKSLSILLMNMYFNEKR